MGVICLDEIQFQFYLRPSEEGQIGDSDIAMEVRAGYPSYCEGLIYAVACTKNEILIEKVSKYRVSGIEVSLPGLNILEIPYDWNGGMKDVWFDFVIKEDNKKGVEDDCEFLLVEY